VDSEGTVEASAEDAGDRGPVVLILGGDRVVDGR
jgi:hypothetical protein